MEFQKLKIMKKISLIFIALFLVSSSMVVGQEKKQNPQLPAKVQAAEFLKPFWDKYSEECKKDSALQVYWEYNGKEKPVINIDSISVPGKKIKIVSVPPTQLHKWIVNQPTFEGFIDYLKQK
jgi:hypothetical protein